MTHSVPTRGSADRRLYRDPARSQPDAGAVAAQSGGGFGRIEPQHPLSQGLLMRAGLLLLPLLVLAACKDEPDFDTRYDKAAKEIEARAKAMNADIAEAEEAAAAKGLHSEAKPYNPHESSGEWHAGHWDGHRPTSA